MPPLQRDWVISGGASRPLGVVLEGTAGSLMALWAQGPNKKNTSIPAGSGHGQMWVRLLIG